MTEPLNIKSIHSQTLDLPPSCIQFCPSQPGIFCVGTYYLHPKQEQEQEPKGMPRSTTMGPSLISHSLR